jgi:ABC-type antimicrobial peptide transport system permease subunit
LAAGGVRLRSLSDGGRVSRTRARDLLLAIPLGIGLYLALFGIAGDTTEEAVIAPWWSLALIPIGTVLVVVAATSFPARLATRIRIADALRYE